VLLEQNVEDRVNENEIAYYKSHFQRPQLLLESIIKTAHNYVKVELSVTILPLKIVLVLLGTGV
jgi:hypothetical protein